MSDGWGPVPDSDPWDEGDGWGPDPKLDAERKEQDERTAKFYRTWKPPTAWDFLPTLDGPVTFRRRQRFDELDALFPFREDAARQAEHGMPGEYDDPH